MGMVPRRKILVIDDDQSVCDVFARTLGDRGYDVYTETRYPEGVRKAEEVLPDLAFVSLLLGTTNGLKVSKEIHAMEKLRNLPVVMLISYKGELDPKYTVTIGVVDVLVKPPRENDIIFKTEFVLGSYAGLNKADQGPPGVSDEEDFVSAAGRPKDSEQPEEFIPVSAVKGDQEGREFEGRLYEIPKPTSDNGDQDREITSRSLAAIRDGEEITMRDASGPHETGDESEELMGFGHEDREADDNPEMQHEDEYIYFDEGEKTGKKRKALMIAAGLALVVIIGIGTFMGLQFLFGRKDKLSVQSPRGDASVLLNEKAKSFSGAGSPSPGPSAQAKKRQAEVTEHGLAFKEPKPSAVQEDELISVQVGFFGNLKNAEVLAEKMKRQGYKAFVKKEEKAAGKTSYRVLIGKFKSREEALGQLKVIRRKEGLKPVLYKGPVTAS